MTIEPNFPNPLGLALGASHKGFRGRLIQLSPSTPDLAHDWDEIERRLIELGFIEGAEIEVLHEGPIGGDPIAVRVEGATVALRRRIAMAIWAEPISDEECNRRGG